MRTLPSGGRLRTVSGCLGVVRSSSLAAEAYHSERREEERI